MKYQSLYNIAFSDDRSDRWKRHFLFWLGVVLYHLVRIGIMMPSMTNMQAFSKLVKYVLIHPMVINIFLVYTTVYFLIPRYFTRKKYWLFAAGFFIVIVLFQGYTFILNLYDMGSSVRDAIGLSKGMFISTFKPGFIRGFGNPPLILGLFLSLKTLKNWHLEQLKTETLAKENANAELQLLKAQVHPHFLFNTLNNIYSFTLSQSPLAATLVQKLSDMLKYMIHDCEKPLVPLEKEIKLIQDYMGLEKVRYGNRLNMEVEVNGDYKNKMIAPLLMIPFVENCFKHGASVMRGQQWIKLRININEEQLDFKLSNSKPPDTNDHNRKKGIGLANVQKRLQLLYPGNHFLITESTGDSYIVHLQISLQQFPVVQEDYKPIKKLQPA